MHVRPDPVRPGQESVWRFPRPAIAEPTAAHIVIELGGVVIADTRRAIRTLETSHPPSYYIPPDDIVPGALVPATGASYCEWKGTARYFDVTAGGERRVRAAWSYPAPTPAFAMLCDHVACYAGAMDACFVDGEHVVPQPGGFYGGWITSGYAGPFKGVPGARAGDGGRGMSGDARLPPGAFAKLDTGDDLAFYAPPRLVTHIDAVATAALTGFYREVLPAGGRLLDLMSSWVSHLPDDRRYAEVVGHGMNAAELAANPRLDRWFVRDLNADPTLPLADGAFDAALCCVGVQYLQRPFEALAEVRRVLVPGAPFVVSYANRCFPTKAVAVWRSLDMQGQAALIRHYLERSGFGDVAVRVLSDGSRGDPLVAVTARA